MYFISPSKRTARECDHYVQSLPRTLIKAESKMGDKPQLIATARPGGPPLSSCPWQWLVPGGNFCANSRSSTGRCNLSPGMFCPDSSSYRSAGRLLSSQHCLLFNILFLILDRAFQANPHSVLGIGARFCPWLQLH